MKNTLNKNWILILIIVVLLGGGLLALNNYEGMSLERLCYTRESDGAKICTKGNSSCTYFPDGSSKCTQGKRECNQFTNCDSCTDPNNKPLGGRCYWNNNQSKCGPKLGKGYLPYCMKPVSNSQINSYVPVISLLPTTTLTNAAQSNYYSM